jgi:peptidyl-prolyl cis-trans isomerase C
MLIKSHVVLVSAIAILLAACSPKDADKTASASTTTTTTTTTTAKTDDAIEATVNGTPITKKEVDLILKQQRGMPDTPETRKMIIDNIALQLIAAQEAVKKGLDKTADILSEIEMAKQSVLAQAYVQDFIKNDAITDAQLNAEYDKLKAQISGNQFKARHILVKTEDEAKAIIAKLNKDNKSFDALAKAESLDPGSKTKGGDLGWFDAKSMVPEFSDAVAKLDKGKFTETPVKSQFGYHVIMLDDTRPNPATVPPMEQVKASLTQQLQQQNLKKMLDDMKAKAKVEIVGVAAAPAAEPAPAATTEPAAAAPAAAPATTTTTTTTTTEPEKK